MSHGTSTTQSSLLFPAKRLHGLRAWTPHKNSNVQGKGVGVLRCRTILVRSPPVCCSLREKGMTILVFSWKKVTIFFFLGGKSNYTRPLYGYSFKLYPCRGRGFEGVGIRGQVSHEMAITPYSLLLLARLGISVWGLG